MSATLYYYPTAGRGELARLIAAAGGIELKEGGLGSDLDKSAFGSPSGLPLLHHGNVKISQSGAIETYLSLLAFPDLAPPERALDSQFCHIKEDVIQGLMKVCTGTQHAKLPGEWLKVIDRWFPIVEGGMPTAGFINGMPYPTAADLAIVNLCEAFFPMGAILKHIELDMAVKYPKMKALVDRTINVTKIQAYMAASTSLNADLPPFNLGALEFEKVSRALDPKAGDVVLITGASTGIGESTALRLAKDGFVVFAGMRGPMSRKEATVLREGGCQVVELDVTSDASCAACVAAVIAKAGRIDGLINNAGIGDTDHVVEECPFEIYTKVMETNYFGTVRMTHLVLPAMRERRKGAIINVTSGAAIAWMPCTGAYGASKAAQEAFTGTLVQEVFRFGVRVCTVRPGAVDTPILGADKHVPKAADSPYWEFAALKKVGRVRPPGPSIISDQMSILLVQRENWEPAYGVGQDAKLGEAFVAKHGTAGLAVLCRVRCTPEEYQALMMKMAMELLGTEKYV